MQPDPVQSFIERWSASGGAERSNYQLFLTELCELLGVPGPNPSVPDNTENAYVFERSVIFINPEGPPSTKFIDLYKRGCFVLETKQGVEADDEQSLLSAAAQERKKRRKKGHATRGSTAYGSAVRKGSEKGS